MPETKHHGLFRLSLVLFFGSGVCALAYETLWVRQLTLSYGISVYAVSAVLAAFMFGLCLGAYLVGRIAARIRNPLRVYGWFELAISVYVVMLHFVLTDWVPALYRLGAHALEDIPLALNVGRFLLTFVLLVIPTTLMGGTLPVLSRFLENDRAHLGKPLGWLYGINTLGAVLGTTLAGFWLLKDLGIFGTLVAAVALNLVVASTALWKSRAAGAAAPAPPAPERASSPFERAPTSGTKLVLWVLFLSGYTALSYEVIWSRTLLLYTHNSTYAFTTILVVYLLGVSLGSLLYARMPARHTSLRTLGLLQLGIAGYVWASFYLIGVLPGLLSRITQVLGTGSWLAAMSTILVATSVVVFVPTVLMGMTFPMGTALSSARANVVGSVTGRAYACLTLGNIVGSLVTGFVLIRWAGLRSAFAVAIALNLLCGFALVSFRPAARGRLFLGGVAGALASLLFLITVKPDIFRSFYEKYVATLGGKILFYREEVTDNVLVYETNRGQRWIFYSDGRGTAGTPTDLANRRSGHIPMMLHPDPKSVLCICFGVGNTLSAMAQYEPERLVIVELSPGAIAAAGYFPTNRNVLSTPNLEVVIEDGRNFLLRTKEKFDVIALEPPELHQAAVVNLYTREFYELAREHLHEGGILCQWWGIYAPTYEQKMLIRAFVDVFPESSLWQSNYASLLLIGFKDGAHIRPEDFLALTSKPQVQADFQHIRTTPIGLLGMHLMGPPSLAEFVRDVPPVTDDRTYIDFSVPRSSEAGFGVFMYNTYQDFRMRDNEGMRKQFEHMLELETNKESAEHLFDFSRYGEEERARFLQELAAAIEDQKLKAVASLKMMLTKGYNSEQG